MPVDRTPPPQQSLPVRIVQRQRSDSEPNLSDKQIDLEALNVTTRCKRKRSSDDCGNSIFEFMNDMKQMFLEFKTQQEQKIEKIYTFIAEIKQQNSEICYSADFLSKSYDSLLEKIEKLESDRQTNHDYIRTLEDKLERAECYTRATCLEVRNIPVPNKESKPQLLNTITNLDCYHCIHRQENHNALIQLKEDTNNSDDEAGKTILTMTRASEIIVLVSGGICFISSVLMSLRLYKGGAVKPVIPCVALFSVSLVSSINMIVEISK
ncbi:unnamed protein product [Arctia plantaginis]|uniref:Uncharacterized protein n=1 Tax=Arctia plantaginis TaxID=874455 RepID=A0A8S0YXK2_ARCPL|nr:unnamed protein product [Arctia plantaginis]